MPPEAVDLVSRLLQYSPSLRSTAVSSWSWRKNTHEMTYVLFMLLTHNSGCKIICFSGALISHDYDFMFLSPLAHCQCSWRHWSIPSLTNYGIPIPTYQMGVFCLHCSTLDLMVSSKSLNENFHNTCPWHFWCRLFSFLVVLAITQSSMGCQWRLWWSWSQSMLESNAHSLISDYTCWIWEKRKCLLRWKELFEYCFIFFPYTFRHRFMCFITFSLY